jgi:disulfide bond formation protein DsbB
MPYYHLLFSDPRRPALLLGLASIAALAGAFTFQAFGFEPCQLCLAQRWPYAGVILLALLSVPIRRARRLLVFLLVVIGLAMLGDSALAFYHTGVEQHWWTNAFDCAAGSTGAASIADLKQQLMATNYVPCDKVQWAFYGISIAAMNVVFAGALGIFALVSALVVAKADA